MSEVVVKFAILNEVPGESVASLTIDRPKALNALNRETLDQLTEVLGKVPKTVRVVIVTGAGEKSFVAGADIKEMSSLSREAAFALSERGQKLFQHLEEAPFVSIAAINGFALGGGLELAMACDVMIASHNAKFGLPEVSLGLIPGYGGTQRLPRYVGRQLARMIALSGDIYPAERGKEWGLFAEVVEPAQLLPRATALAKTLASRSPVALRLAKRAINEGCDLAQAQGLQLEAELFAQTFTSHDHDEGILAFLEKRAPQFKGN